MVVVPRIADREGITLEAHRGMGHYGVQRVLDRLQQNYWWRKMGDTVVKTIKACSSCARSKAGFRESGKAPTLAHPTYGVPMGGGLCRTLGYNGRR